MKNQFIIALIIIWLFNACDQKYKNTIIAFGSCSHESDSVQMWNQVIAHHPIAWIWMGDNIYADTYDMDLMQSKYQIQKSRASYQKMMQSMDIYGIWDDHDYGINDGGKEYYKKNESKKLMLEFLDIPKTHEVWERPGAYQSYILSGDDLTIKLILLDTRYFRDTLEVNLDRPPLYHPNYKGSILGEDQWTWLEHELMDSDADIHLIGSSIQLIPDDHGYEKWGNFPNERQRFFDLMVKAAPSRPIILSGDRHIAEFSKIELEGLDFPLYEFTSSGLTHTWNLARAEENKHRLGELVVSKNFGIIEIAHQKRNINIQLRILGSNNEVLEETQLEF